MKLADGIAMHAEDLGGLAKFVVVAEESSFTRAPPNWAYRNLR